MFEKSEAKVIKPPKGKSHGILWLEATAFSFLIALSWLTEAMRIPHMIFGEPFIPNYRRAALRSVILLMIWSWVFLVTRRLLKRLHYLEEFLRVCSWCRKVCHEQEWLDMEKYFNSKFATKTSHGMCPACLKKQVDKIAANEKQPAAVLPEPAKDRGSSADSSVAERWLAS